MKKIIYISLCIAFCWGCKSQSPTEGGTIGQLTWSLSGGALTISGTGEIPDYYYDEDTASDNDTPPWYNYADDITKINITDGVTSIGYAAFAGCSRLVSMNIPNSLVNIGGMSFGDGASLTSINVDNGNTVYSSEDGVLFDKSKTKIYTYPGGIKNSSYHIPASVNSIEDAAFLNNTNLTSITIPNSVTTIKDHAFWFCTSLTSITLPKSATDIAEAVFCGCTALTSINVDGDNPEYASKDGVLFNKSKTKIIEYPAGRPDSSYNIPNPVDTVGMSAFSYCTNLTTITIPGSVTTIEGWAFSGCSSLDSITIPKSVTSIGEYAFSVCESLSSVIIPSSITNIAEGTFGACTSLSAILLPYTITSIERIAFGDCTSLRTVAIFSATPPSTDSTSFANVSLSDASLVIPHASRSAYEAAEVWKDFGTIRLYIVATPEQ
jgi:hypothetical protein